MAVSQVNPGYPVYFLDFLWNMEENLPVCAAHGFSFSIEDTLWTTFYWMDALFVAVPTVAKY